MLSLLWIPPSYSQPGHHSEQDGSLPGRDLFTEGTVVRIAIQIQQSEMESLRRQSRDFVRATVTEAKTVYQNVAIHLKGSVGSFRVLDDKPALTLDFSLFNPDEKFHGLRRIHLNNSVEDPSYCNEYLGSELFRKAGVPAPRVTRAVVLLNERRLGVYVLKEGFTEDFLACYFKRVSGNLYEPGEGHDVNQCLKRISVEGPKQGRATLKALANAALDPDLSRRWLRLQKVLEMDRFIAFMVMEVILCHRDGYSLARNNFRVYEDLDIGKAQFFPHGMDQLLGKADLPWEPHMAGLVARAIVETPEGKERYRTCFKSVLANIFKAELLTNRVEGLIRELRPFVSHEEFVTMRNECGLVQERIVQRQRSLTEQLSQPPGKLMEFSGEEGPLEGWMKVDEVSSAKMECSKSPDGIAALHIIAAPETAASWRTKAFLSPGRYRFEGKAKVGGVKPLPFGRHQGVGLRVSGSERQATNLIGDSSWRVLATEFQVNSNMSEVEFICELRASAGEAWYDVNSLRVVRVR